jgi:multicomponent Na+:H+ antiporter subunit D
MMSEWIIPPGIIMVGGALVLPFVPKAWRSLAFLIFPLLALAVVWTLPTGLQLTVEFMRYTLVLCEVDSLSRVFGMIFALIAFAGGVYSYHVKELGQQVAALLYAGSALGVTFAGDWLTLFVFWEVMAVASTYLVWARRTKASQQAGMRYLLVHLFGGSLLLAGILMTVAETGSMEIVRMTSTFSSWLVLAGVALNAAIPPLHAWLADAYPKATVTGAVFLSAFTTKSAVYVLARVFPGWEILIALGVVMALYGVVFAVLANDIREILAYHIISQVGYMVAGVGIGTEMAINGTTAHAFSHILYKALLFMGVGAVLHTTGRSKLTELGGLAKAMPVTLWLYMVGAFSISGFPLFNGFISKSMIVSAAGDVHLDWVFLLLMLASVGTFLHTGLKLPYFTWYAEDRGIRPERPPMNMHLGMAFVASLCILFGVLPSLLYRYLPYPVVYEPYTIPHLVETTQILIFTFVAFWAYRLKLSGEPTIALDTDWFYRRPARLARMLVVDSTAAAFQRTEDWSKALVAGLAGMIRNPAPGLQRLLGVRSMGEVREEFDPSAARPRMEYVITLVLICLVLVAVLSLLVPRL